MRTKAKFVVQSLIVAALLMIAGRLEARVEIPSNSSPVVDQAGILSSSDKFRLEDYLKAQKIFAQIQIWIFKSLEGEPIESLSIRAADQWRLGTKKEDNGILILVAQEDRQMRIEVGQGLEGRIPDVLAARIIDQIMVPQFRRGDFYLGLREASEQIVQLAVSTGDVKIPPALDTQAQAQGSRRKASSFEVWIWLAFIILSLIFGRFRRRYGLIGGMGGWRSGGSGWGGGGGGGWSGGGGGFSGGGASGRW